MAVSSEAMGCLKTQSEASHGSFADASLSGEKVAAVLERVIAERGAPQSITVDNGPSSPARRWICGLIKMQCTWTSSGQDDRWKMVISRTSTADCGTSA